MMAFDLMMVGLCLAGLALAIVAALTPSVALRAVLMAILFGTLAVLKHSGMKF
jgi:hypothetical protein